VSKATQSIVTVSVTPGHLDHLAATTSDTSFRTPLRVFSCIFSITPRSHFYHPAMRRISEDTRNGILSLIDAGLSSRKVEAQLGVSSMTVSRVRAEARPCVQKSRSGRPAKLTATDKRRLVRMVTSGKADNAVQVTRELKDITNVDYSVHTVRRALKEAGLKASPKKRSRGFWKGISSNAATSP
jgi:transposase